MSVYVHVGNKASKGLFRSGVSHTCEFSNFTKTKADCVKTTPETKSVLVCTLQPLNIESSIALSYIFCTPVMKDM